MTASAVCDVCLAMANEIVKIKKYDNRRLYSTSEKCYLTMPEIEKLIVGGRKIQVTEASSDRDITSEILTMILLEKGKAQHFPADFLEQMIRVSEDAVGGFFSRSISQGFGIMNQVQDEIEAFYKRFGLQSFIPNSYSDQDQVNIDQLRSRVAELEKKLEINL